MDTKQIKQFQKIVWDYYKKHKRTLPWRGASCTPYHILVSEIMLQQTQVDRVIPKYHSFIKTFPNFKKLSSAKQADVIKLWQGLGYNRRAKMLFECAKVVHEKYHGTLPRDIKTLVTLPGIGPYTAAAIMCFAFNTPAVVIETNIRTVYLYHFFKNKKNVTDAMLIPYITQTMDTKHAREWYAALMDYGSHLKKIHGNLSRLSKHYVKQSPFEGSRRQIRGAILRTLSNAETLTLAALTRQTTYTKDILTPVLADLISEKMITKQGTRYRLA